MVSDIFTKIRSGSCGPGGLKCDCCNTKPARGKGKKKAVRSVNRKARTRLNEYLPIEEQ